MKTISYWLMLIYIFAQYSTVHTGTRIYVFHVKILLSDNTIYYLQMKSV